MIDISNLDYLPILMLGEKFKPICCGSDGTVWATDGKTWFEYESPISDDIAVPIVGEEKNENTRT